MGDSEALSDKQRRLLAKHYFDPALPYSLIGDAERFYKGVKEHIGDISLAQVKAYLLGQPVFTTSRQPTCTSSATRCRCMRSANWCAPTSW